MSSLIDGLSTNDDYDDDEDDDIYDDDLSDLSDAIDYNDLDGKVKELTLDEVSYDRNLNFMNVPGASGTNQKSLFDAGPPQRRKDTRISEANTDKKRRKKKRRDRRGPRYDTDSVEDAHPSISSNKDNVQSNRQLNNVKLLSRHSDQEMNVKHDDMTSSSGPHSIDIHKSTKSSEVKLSNKKSNPFQSLSQSWNQTSVKVSDYSYSTTAPIHEDHKNNNKASSESNNKIHSTLSRSSDSHRLPENNKGYHTDERFVKNQMNVVDRRRQVNDKNHGGKTPYASYSYEKYRNDESRGPPTNNRNSRGDYSRQELAVKPLNSHLSRTGSHSSDNLYGSQRENYTKSSYDQHTRTPPYMQDHRGPPSTKNNFKNDLYSMLNNTSSQVVSIKDSNHISKLTTTTTAISSTQSLSRVSTEEQNEDVHVHKLYGPPSQSSVLPPQQPVSKDRDFYKLSNTSNRPTHTKQEGSSHLYRSSHDHHNRNMSAGSSINSDMRLLDSLRRGASIPDNSNLNTTMKSQSSKRELYSEPLYGGGDPYNKINSNDNSNSNRAPISDKYGDKRRIEVDNKFFQKETTHPIRPPSTHNSSSPSNFLYSKREDHHSQNDIDVNKSLAPYSDEMNAYLNPNKVISQSPLIPLPITIPISQPSGTQLDKQPVATYSLYPPNPYDNTTTTMTADSNGSTYHNMIASTTIPQTALTASAKEFVPSPHTTQTMSSPNQKIQLRASAREFTPNFTSFVSTYPNTTTTNTTTTTTLSSPTSLNLRAKAFVPSSYISKSVSDHIYENTAIIDLTVSGMTTVMSATSMNEMNENDPINEQSGLIIVEASGNETEELHTKDSIEVTISSISSSSNNVNDSPNVFEVDSIIDAKSSHTNPPTVTVSHIQNDPVHEDDEYPYAS